MKEGSKGLNASKLQLAKKPRESGAVRTWRMKVPRLIIAILTRVRPAAFAAAPCFFVRTLEIGMPSTKFHMPRIRRAHRIPRRVSKVWKTGERTRPPIPLPASTIPIAAPRLRSKYAGVSDMMGK